jgi:hypothetical protein
MGSGRKFGHIVTEETRRKISIARSNPSEETRLRLRLAKLGKPTKKLIDLTGKQFGQLTVLRRGANKGQRVGWLCRCSCGVEVTVAANALASRNTTKCWSCGTKSTGVNHTTHGHAHSRIKNTPCTPEYSSYMKAKARCNNPNNNRYSRYGGRGIKFLFTSFEEFLAEVGERPEPKADYSIDRIDNDGNYEKGNVRWATNQEQHSNR